MKIDLATSYLDNYFNYKKLNCVNHLYDTKIKKLDKFCVNVFFLPWYHKEPVTTFTDDAFVSKMSEEKIKQLALKLRDLLASMKEHDYDPKKFKDRKLGHVTGYFLKHGSPEDKLRFYVVSGNHRVAAYKSLFPERNSIPIIFEDFRFMKPRDRQNCGFLALEENTHLHYKTTALHNGNAEGAIHPLKSGLNLDWGLPEEEILLSEKDKTAQTLENYKLNPKF